MANMAMEKTPMPEQAADIRNKNFEEVTLGYTEEMAVNEAKRCLNCKNMPCVQGCPVNIHIPEFISKVAESDFAGAYKVITKTNALPAISGRVCPQETQCEMHCVRGIKGEPVAIGRLERFVADWYRANVNEEVVKPESNGIKVAVVGSGPSSLTCASDLAMAGYQVTIFEAFHTAGGVLVYGIPEFRLPKAIVQHEVDGLSAHGVEIKTDMVIGKVLTIDELFEMDFKAVFIGTGAGLPSFMGIDGEALSGVYSANEYLTRINLMKAYRNEYDTPVKHSKNVAVVGGGNVAMDAARCAKRLGAENVYIVYRRSEEEMPARKEEIHHAKQEGVEFLTLHNPVEYIGDERGRVCQMRLQKMELGEPDASGRRSPVPIPGAIETIDIDEVIVSVGVSPNPLVPNSIEGLEVTPKGTIVVNADTLQSSIPDIYAGGDIVRGGATVILAMGDGRRAAAAMHKALQEK